MPRQLQANIHSDFSSDSGVWTGYRAQVTGLYATHARSDLDDHVVREFNKKIDRLAMPEDLFIEPHDAGFRYIGDGVTFG